MQHFLFTDTFVELFWNFLELTGSDRFDSRTKFKKICSNVWRILLLVFEGKIFMRTPGQVENWVVKVDKNMNAASTNLLWVFIKFLNYFFILSNFLKKYFSIFSYKECILPRKYLRYCFNGLLNASKTRHQMLTESHTPMALMCKQRDIWWIK